jgi:hypothetical protein
MWFLISEPFRHDRCLVPIFVTWIIGFSLAGIMDPWRTPYAPFGLVSFQLAGTSERAHAIIESWNQRQREWAPQLLVVDSGLVIPLYSTGIGLGCILAGRRLLTRGGSLGKRARIAAWGLTVAWPIDLIENGILLGLLTGSVSDPWPLVACCCALLKFGLIVIGLAYMALGINARRLGPTATASDS